MPRVVSEELESGRELSERNLLLLRSKSKERVISEGLESSRELRERNLRTS